MSSEARFCRQEILAEVGPTGQARLGSATLYLESDLPDLAATMARAYAERAGISRVLNKPEGTKAQATAGGPWLRYLRHESPRSLATGATLALEVMRETLGLDAPLHREL